MKDQNGKPDLIMQQLTITRRRSYETNPGKYKAEIQYESGENKHTLTLDEVISERMLTFIGPVICEAAAMVAKEAEKNIVRSIEALHNQQAIEAGDLVNAGVSQTAPPGGPATPEQWLPSGSDQADRGHEMKGPEDAGPDSFQVPKEPGDSF